MKPGPALDPTATQPPDDSEWAAWLARVAAAPDPVPLVRADQEARWRAGTVRSVDDYLVGLPGLSVGDAVDLVVAEAALRRERGEILDVAEYQRRFPSLATDLAARFKFLPLLATAATVSRVPLEAATLTASDGARVVGPAVYPTIPEYEILEELGRGGMGVVYKARHLHLKRIDALKIVRGGGPAMGVVRFLAEAEAAAAVDHPHVVRVRHLGEHDGAPFLAMEYLPGGTLADRLRAGVWRPVAAATLVEKLARGVAAAHDQGIVHRDLKPSNVLFDEAGEPKVADFGLAKRLGGAGLTQSEAVLGTPAYMAPEQARGDTKSAGPAADVWALGVILYECLTGALPFRAAESWGVLHKVLEEEPAAPRRARAGIPRDLELICLKCLSKDPRARYATAAGLADDLARFLSGRPVQVRPASRLERSWRWCRRNPAIAGLLAGVAAALVAGTAVSTWYAAADRRRGEAEDARLAAVWEKAEADAARQVAQKEKAAAADSQARAEWAAYRSQILLAQREWEVGNAPAALRVLDATQVDRRGWEFTYLCHLFTRHQRWTGPLPGPPNGLALRPDGKHIAVAVGGRAEGTLIVLEPATGRRVFTARSELPLGCVTYSPDGGQIAAADGDWFDPKPSTILLWDAAGGGGARELASLPRPARTLAFFPSGTHLIAGCADGNTYKVDTRSGRVARLVVTQSGLSARVALSPDGKLLATADAMGMEVRLWDTGTGRLIRALDAPPADTAGPRPLVYTIAFSPDSGALAGGGRGLFLWDAASGRCRWSRPVGSGSQFTSVAWDRDGRMVVTGSEDRAVATWDATTGSPGPRLIGHLAAVQGICPAGPGVVLSVSSDLTVRAWHPDLPSNPRVLATGGLCWFNDVRYTPDGTQLVSVSGEGTLRRWDVRSGRLAFQTRTHDPHAVAIGPDGTTLAATGEDYAVKVWDLRTNVHKHTMAGHAGVVTGLAYVRGGDLLVTAGWDGTVRVWDPIAGREVRRLFAEGPEVRRMTSWPHRSTAAASPDGRLVAASTGSGEIRVWETSTWTELHRLRHHAPGQVAIAFSPDGKLLVSGGADQELCLWDVGTGLKRWSQPTNPIGTCSAAFFPDGNRFVTGGGVWAAPGEVKVWDTLSGENVLTLRAHAGEVYGVAVSPDGWTVASCSHDDTIKLWSAGGEPVADRTRGWAPWSRGR
jgi:eukaryotic-like serine/threonine-protein kinase